MRIFKKIFRYPLSNCFMLIGFIIATLSLFWGILMYYQAMDQIKDSNKYKYNNQRALSISNKSQAQWDFKSLFSDIEVNVDFCNVMLTLNDADKTVLAEISSVTKEEIVYDLSEGSYPSDTQISSGEHVINIGKAYLEYTYQKENNRYIKVNNTEYKVIGIIGSSKSDVLDYSLLLNYYCLSDFERSSIETGKNLEVRFASNYKNVNTDCQKFINKINLISGSEYVVSDEVNSAIAYSSKNESKMFCFLIYGFALGICIIISELWIYERKEEIAIQKTFGLSNFLICKKFYAEFLLLLMLASFVSFFIQGLLLLFDKKINLLSFYQLFTIVLMLIVTSLVIFMVPIYKISKKMPNDILNSRGDF